ncbi:MAG: hypothetical protein AAGJ35_01345, partial [Myxococcota bacterium]
MNELSEEFTTLASVIDEAEMDEMLYDLETNTSNADQKIADSPNADLIKFMKDEADAERESKAQKEAM